MIRTERRETLRAAGRGARAAAGLEVLILYAQPVLWSMGEGRGAAIFTRLPQAIARRGHHVRVSLPGPPERSLDGRGPGGDGAGAAERRPEIYHGFELHRAPASRSFVPDPACPPPERLLRRISCWLSYQRWAMTAARKLALEIPPDLVVGMGDYEAPVARRLAREIGVPNVTRLFGSSLSLQARRGLRVLTNFPEIIALKSPADLIILNDDGADGERVAARLKVPRDRFHHLRNGVDFSLFRPGPPGVDHRRRLGIRPEQAVLLTATRLAAEKRLERAVEGLRGLLSLGTDAALILLGDGPERSRLESLARRLGLQDRVHLPGPIVQEELADWYRGADIVLSLLDRTNGANPVFEAMACGRVVVALDVGTTREVVEHDRTGVLLSPGELPLLGSILAELLEDPERRRRLGAEAARRIPSVVMNLEDRLNLEVDLLEEAVRRRRGGNGIG